MLLENCLYKKEVTITTMSQGIHIKRDVTGGKSHL